MDGTTTTLHLIRHADAVPGDESELDPDGGYDLLGLSHKGAAQAEALARRFAVRKRLQAVYASPTRRAFETAHAVARACGLTVVADDRLREVYLGSETVSHIAPEKRASAVRERLKMMAALALRDGSWSALPDVEAGAAVRARMTEAVEAIAAQHAGEHVALVSHAGSINAYVAELIGVQRDFFFPTGNASISSVRFEDGRRLLLRLNDTAHLER